MRVADLFAPGPAIQIGMDHLPHDRSGPDDCHLHDDVVERLRLEARQRRHLRARLHLEDTDRVGVAEHLVDGRIVLRQMGEIEDGTSGQV